MKYRLFRKFFAWKYARIGKAEIIVWWNNEKQQNARNEESYIYSDTGKSIQHRVPVSIKSVARGGMISKIGRCCLENLINYYRIAETQ